MTGRRIGLIGWYGFGNVGDELLLELLHRALRPARVFSTKDAEVSGIEVLDVARLDELQDELDLVVVGGGGLLNERFIARLELERLRVPYGFLSVGVPHPEWLAGTADVLRAARFVTVRDHLALEEVRALDPEIDAWWLPDAAFLLALPEYAAEYAGAPSSEADVVLVPRTIPEGWLRAGDPRNPERAQLRAFRRLRRRSKRRFETLVFEARDEKLGSRFDPEPRVVDTHEAVRAIAAADAVISARLHGAVIAACVGTPFAMVDYQDKMRGFAQLLGLPENACRPLGDADFRGWLENPGPPLDLAVARAYGTLVARFCTWLREGP